MEFKAHNVLKISGIRCALTIPSIKKITKMVKGSFSKISFSGVILMSSLLFGCSTQTRNIDTNSTPHYTPQQSSHSPVRSTLVSNAYKNLGVPYRYGGTTSNGMDCSGLTQTVYKNSGISIPRTTAQQRDASRTIHISRLLPGDLIFFKTSAKSNHVGIYIGDRKFIHASTGSKRVKVDQMDKQYWRQRFVKFGTYL
ncbi:MAG: Unknown protein [uncultured Thiotrichaceae bacterium]|uniref:NlpC/P60 domain-containing protein n=1 Tax=uncultured Thiotrichaceae bacterium TaxID=298394 RepID=A0A6S6U5M2_9GAMM|nr:MAG: Unknown protein [uncultured Thiotrichaceae bacterium]